MGDGEPDAQSGQAVRLGEGPQDTDIGPVTVELDTVRHLGVADELAVGLVEHHQHVSRHPVEEALQLRPPHDRAGRVVGVADEDQPGPVGDRVGHRVEIVHVTGGQWHLDRPGAADLRDDRVGLEGPPGVDHLVAGPRSGLDQLLGDTDRPGAGGQVGEGHAEPLGQLVHPVSYTHL